MEIKKELKYDVFIFYNELDLLEIRLNILYEYVDFFIIVSSFIVSEDNVVFLTAVSGLKTGF